MSATVAAASRSPRERGAPLRIAVVGAGVAGLTCAHLLDPRHEVTVFDAQARPGGHAHTVDVSDRGRRLAVDVGFIVLNERNYPSFQRLLRRLGVATQPSEMSFSFRSEPDGIEYAGGRGADGVLAQRRNLGRPAFARMLADIVRFNRHARELVAQHATGAADRDGPWLAPRRGGPTIGELLDQGGYSRAFVDWHLVPMAAAIWSTDRSRIREFPAAYLAAFLSHHGLLELRGRPRWRSVSGGSRTYVRAIVDRLRGGLRLQEPVRALARDAAGVTVRTAQGSERFDEAIVATHSDQALALLADPCQDERRLLGAIPYQRNEAVLHTDRSLLPSRRAAWASWNYHVLDAGGRRASLTYHMNRLQRLDADAELCVTLNASEAVDPGSVIETLSFDHPLYTPRGVAAQAEHHRLVRTRRTSFCGAYWGWGFHEDGVRSALRVCRAYGVELTEPARSPAGSPSPARGAAAAGAAAAAAIAGAEIHGWEGASG